MTTTLEDTRARAFRPEMADSVGSATETPGWNLDTERRTGDGKVLARGLAWFSIGLGLYELLAPRHLARTLGMEDQTALIQAYGVREIATGVGILARRRPVEFVWGRVAGDALDLATLAPGLSGDNPRRGNVAIAMGAVAGVALLDVLCASELSRRIVHD
ncbi:hypothetical protein [Longimicrobium sp.]|uniref:hypothetical protein n=1 Tax=Longimicrobium sp. TaxID=2029185 RepID=UPI003B3B5D04